MNDPRQLALDQNGAAGEHQWRRFVELDIRGYWSDEDDA